MIHCSNFKFSESICRLSLITKKVPTNWYFTMWFPMLNLNLYSYKLNNIILWWKVTARLTLYILNMNTLHVRFMLTALIISPTPPTLSCIKTSFSNLVKYIEQIWSLITMLETQTHMKSQDTNLNCKAKDTNTCKIIR
jgi:hypothetical protein